MAQLYSTGPALIFVGLGNGGTPVFYGTCEHAPVIEAHPSYTHVYNDLGGQQTPYDSCYDGEYCTVSGDFNRHNENVYTLMAEKARSGINNGGGRGTDIPGGIGRLMLTEGATYIVYVQFPYAFKAAFQSPISGPMPLGYRFHAGYLDRDSMPDLGTKARKWSLNWFCLRSFDLNFTNTVGQGRFVCYDHDLTALNGVFIN